jgi:hypothetical protein
MSRQFGQLQRMESKIAQLIEKAKLAESDKARERYLRQADQVQARIQAIRDNWKAFTGESRGNTNRRGIPHSSEARRKMSERRRAFWKSKAGFEKMWRARRRRQYREKKKCLLRFPRLPSSVDKEWLRAYRKRYKSVVGTLPEMYFHSNAEA